MFWPRLHEPQVVGEEDVCLLDTVTKAALLHTIRVLCSDGSMAVNSHQLADPRQDDSRIFWFLKFAPLHFQSLGISTCFSFSFFLPLQDALNWYDILHQLICSIEQLNYWGPLYESGRLHLGVSYSFGRESFWGGAGGGLFMSFYELCEEKTNVGQNI